MSPINKFLTEDVIDSQYVTTSQLLVNQQVIMEAQKGLKHLSRMIAKKVYNDTTASLVPMGKQCQRGVQIPISTAVLQKDKLM